MTETEFTKAYKALKRIDDALVTIAPGDGIKIEFEGEIEDCKYSATMNGLEIGGFFWKEFKEIYDALEKLKRLEFDEMVDNSLASGISEESPYDFLKKLREQIPSRHPMAAEADRITEEEIFDELEKKPPNEAWQKDWEQEWRAYGKRQNEELTDQILRLKQLKNGLQNDNYYGCPIDDDFEALDAGIEALENCRHEALKRFKK